MSKPNTETELKLRGSASQLRSLSTFLGKTAADGSSFKSHQRAVYFDTAERTLLAAGLSLRIREEDGRFFQTLKQSDASDPLGRGEWTDPVDSLAPDLGTRSGRKLKRLCGSLVLKPQFHVDVLRTAFKIRPRPGTVIEVALDRGRIAAYGRAGKEPISEIELELKQGAPAALYAVALEAFARARVHIETRSKAARGYRLAAPRYETPVVKAGSPRLRKNQTIADALLASARLHFAQMFANAARAKAGDPDSIHQMRVSLRRLRSILYAVRDRLPESEYEPVRMKLKRLLQSLGAARDWEVISRRLDRLPDAGQHVKQRTKTAKTEAMVRAKRVLASSRNDRMILEVLAWFENLPKARFAAKLRKTVGEEAGEILEALFDKVRRRARHFDRQSPEQRHRLRIACKNLRYNVELYAPVFDHGTVARFLNALKPVQDDLGAMNDVSRAHELLGKGADAAAVLTRLDRQAAAMERRARRDVSVLRAAKTFW